MKIGIPGFSQNNRRTNPPETVQSCILPGWNGQRKSFANQRSCNKQIIQIASLYNFQGSFIRAKWGGIEG